MTGAAPAVQQNVLAAMRALVEAVIGGGGGLHFESAAGGAAAAKISAAAPAGPSTPEIEGPPVIANPETLQILK